MNDVIEFWTSCDRKREVRVDKIEERHDTAETLDDKERGHLLHKLLEAAQDALKDTRGQDATARWQALTAALDEAGDEFSLKESQVHAGLDGVQRLLLPPPATDAPYADSGAAALPTSLGAALDALDASTVMAEGFGTEVVRLYGRIKRSEALRLAQAEDDVDWQRREYFSRY